MRAAVSELGGADESVTPGLGQRTILAAAAPAVADYLQTGTPPTPMTIQETITVTVKLAPRSR